MEPEEALTLRQGCLCVAIPSSRLSLSRVLPRIRKEPKRLLWPLISRGRACQEARSETGKRARNGSPGYQAAHAAASASAPFISSRLLLSRRKANGHQRACKGSSANNDGEQDGAHLMPKPPSRGCPFYLPFRHALPRKREGLKWLL